MTILLTSRRLPTGEIVDYRGTAAQEAAAVAWLAERPRPCPSCSGMLRRVSGTTTGQEAVCGTCHARWRWDGHGWTVVHEQPAQEITNIEPRGEKPAA